ncbi:hypothetical protein, partial [Streptomyces rhizosphaericola]|uniref:hypothetical protein n=1 Tax=Streptomyces rhizosphaericola TaxID=2564098 RepID=UPI0019D26A81
MPDRPAETSDQFTQTIGRHAGPGRLVGAFAVGLVPRTASRPAAAVGAPAVPAGRRRSTGRL